MISALPRLMLVTDRSRTCGRALDPLIAAAVEGGLRLVQLREPELRDEELLRWVERLRRDLGSSVYLVINGRPELARECATGLHLPAAQSLAQAAGESRATPLGRSVHGADETRRALRDAPDYLIAGHVYPTRSKPGLPARGTELIAGVCSIAAAVPVFAIGGVRDDRVDELLRAGALGVAVSGALLEAANPAAAARRLCDSIERAVANGEKCEQ